jgi:hypothetical protein
MLGLRHSVSVATVGFLHTAQLHVGTFRTLLREIAPELTDIHLVDEDLLSEARERGVDDALLARLQARLADLVEQDVEVVICTCSTLGASAEALSAAVSTPVLRVDRPMAELAVSQGRAIVVVATLASTLARTRQPLEQSASRVGVDILVSKKSCAPRHGRSWRPKITTATCAASHSTSRTLRARSPPRSSCSPKRAWRASPT